MGNVVAIDNKIEQAMDLVKTHLTFAVREEVEILRSTIADLESKVANLEVSIPYRCCGHKEFTFRMRIRS